MHLCMLVFVGIVTSTGAWDYMLIILRYCGRVMFAV